MVINKQILFDKLENEGISSGNAKVSYSWNAMGVGYVENDLADSADHVINGTLNATVKPGISVGSTDYVVNPANSNSTDGGNFESNDVISVGSKVEYDNWTAFLNVKESLCGNQTDKKRSRVLLTSMDDLTVLSGFMVGINGSNKLFYEYINSSGIKEAEVLNRVIGDKDLISISSSKSSNSITLGVYDPVKGVGEYSSFGIDPLNYGDKFYIGGTLAGITLTGTTYADDNYRGFQGYIENFLLLSGSYGESYLNKISDVFFLTAYARGGNVTSQSPYDIVTGYTESQIIAGQGITGYEMQTVNVQDGQGNVTSVLEEVPMYGNLYENQITYLTGPNTASLDATAFQTESKTFDYTYIKNYANPCILWDSSFSNTDKYEVYRCDVYSNKINLKSYKKNRDLFPLNTNVYNPGDKVNIYLNGKIQESGVDYQVTLSSELSGVATEYLEGDEVVYDIIDEAQNWFDFTGWVGTMTLGASENKDVYLNKLKLISGIDYQLNGSNLEIYASNFATGRMALIPRFSGTVGTYNGTLTNHGICFADKIISEQVWMNGARNSEKLHYNKKTKCDISCDDPDPAGVSASFVDAKTNKIFGINDNIIITGTHQSFTNPTPTPIIPPTVVTTVPPTISTTTTSGPISYTYYYGWDCSTLGNVVPTIIVFLDTAGIFSGTNDWPEVVKLDNGTCVSNIVQETDEISISGLPETTTEIFNSDDCGSLPDENTACITCLGQCPTTTTASPGTTTTAAPGATCKYQISAYLYWPGDEDLDVYVKTSNGCDNQSSVVYWGNTVYVVDSENYMILNLDAHPICAASPIAPESIMGVFTDNRQFEVWWNQHSSCETKNNSPVMRLSISNTGDNSIQVNGTSVAAGAVHYLVNSDDSSVGGSLEYAGYANGDQSNFVDGTTVTITGCPACGG